ncbi:RidA family protein [Variovorax sp. E3]|uniref:RidA family protein n=1 Tax=Variovorax sp. E3 TaxID=1914993 RepID=UPI0018DE0184|nr:RidA family protein [Variovorax sp. E3]
MKTPIRSKIRPAFALVTLMLAAAAASAQSPSTVESRLKAELTAMGYPEGKLPSLAPDSGPWLHGAVVGNLLFLSSAAPQDADGQWVKGSVPDKISVQNAPMLARRACVRQIARMKHVLGDLDRVKRIAYVRFNIAVAPGFSDLTPIAEGCSTLYTAVFGEAGKHPRVLEGVSANPSNTAMEVETIVEVR